MKLWNLMRGWDLEVRFRRGYVSLYHDMYPIDLFMSKLFEVCTKCDCELVRCNLRGTIDDSVVRFKCKDCTTTEVLKQFSSLLGSYIEHMKVRY